MEGQVVRRRVNTIAGHFAANDDISASATHVFPMNCSNTLNTCIRRCDNRLNFARQGSNSQGFFMRQISAEQASYFVPNASYKCSSYANEGNPSFGFEAPMFSRPAKVDANIPKVRNIQGVLEDYKPPIPACETPKFARPNRGIDGQEQFCSKRNLRPSESNGFEWSPRMDVVESRCSYILTIELPGVSINDMRVEVTEQNLIVTGNRSTQWWKVAACSNDSFSEYHKREILQGPCHVVWSLPANVNKDRVSAEFVDGFLRITIPKY